MPRDFEQRCSLPFTNEGIRTMQTSTIPVRERTPDAIIAYSIKEACRVTSLGRTAIYGLIADDKVKTRKIGSRTLILADSLQRLIDGEG
jgi:predicted DNA-binding transcriptional regulator AlpA